MNAAFYMCVLVSWKLVSSSSEEINLGENLTNFDNDFTEVLENSDHQHASIGSKRCMADLGCFEITKDFYHLLYRPVNFLPQDRATINTKFYLYTKDHPKEHHKLRASEPSEIKNSAVDPAHRTVFIVHGFFDSRFYGKWMEDVKDNILLHSNHNVFIVDWSGGNGAPYTQATANSRVVGAEIALFIETLQKLKGVSPMNCYIIGHSLGAHIAGYAGEKLNKLGRITGLDPAQPYFQYMPPSVRLDRTDADFVDVIHTDSASHKLLPLGMSEAVGHLDFYPNNGMDQPGCANAAMYSIFLEGLIDATRRFIACNHQRAIDFFTYSINHKRALPVAYQCTSWDHYLNGFCAECKQDGKKCAILGIHADQYKPHKNDSHSVKMYLATSAQIPFWEYTYQVKVKLMKPKTEFQDRQGDINIKLHGSKSDYDLKLSTKSGNLIHGATYTFLVRQPKELGELHNILFGWTSSSWNFFTTKTLYLDYVKIIPMNFNNWGTQKLQSKIFCDKQREAIKSKTVIFLEECK